MRATSGSYISRLDHLRFIAALLVISWHALHHIGIPLSYVPKFWPLSIFEEGHTGVALFMTLSGFIFCSICYCNEIIYWEFIRNRILRIAPLFLTHILLSYSVWGWDPIKTIVAVIFFMNHPNVIEVGWTVVVEFQFYFLFPFLLVFKKKYGIRYFFGLIIMMVSMRIGIWWLKGSVQELSYWTIFGRIDQFIFGMIGYEIYFRYKKFLAQPLIFFLVLFFGIFLFHKFNIIGGLEGTNSFALWIYLPTLEGAFYAFIIASYLALNLQIPKILDKLLAWLGMLSFSLYMNHMLVILFMSKLLTRLGWTFDDFGGGMTFSLLICAPLVILCSVGTYYLIERPFLSLRRNYLFSNSN